MFPVQIISCQYITFDIASNWLKLRRGIKLIFEKFQDVGASNNFVRVIVTSAAMAFT